MARRSSISWKPVCWCKRRSISHLSDRLLQNSFNVGTLNLSRLHWYITHLVCTRWLGGVRFRGNTPVGVKTRSISHLSDRFLQNSFNVDTLNLSRLHRYITYLVCTRWLGGVRFRGNTRVGVTTRSIKTRSISHLSDRFLQNSFNVDTLNPSWLQRPITYLVSTRWLGGIRFRGNTCVGVKTRSAPPPVSTLTTKLNLNYQHEN